jgi:glucuronokinase
VPQFVTCFCSIVLSGRNFTLSYDTNIPRQVGLAGSSAIVTAALHALMAFYEISDDQLPKTSRPQLVLDVEKQELSINAGLQDRVVQVRFQKFNLRKRLKKSATD